MRLDHLLSKENILFICFVTGGCWLVPGWWQSFFVIAWCWLVPGGGKFLFSGETCPARVLCVWGISETKMSVFVFWFVLFVWHAVGYLEQHLLF